MKKWILSVVSLALLFVVGCQKEPVVESATFSFNRDVVEVKAEGGIPLWLMELLTWEHIHKQSFSKYGKAYQQMLEEHLVLSKG